MDKIRKHIPTILLVVLCVASILSYLRIGDLEDQVRRLQSELNSMDNRLRNDMANLVGNVEHVLEQEASILADYQYVVGELDADTLTIPVTVTVTPKYQQEGTTVALQTETETVHLARSGAEYTATLDMAIDEELYRPLAVITVDGKQSVQTLEWYLTPLDYVKLYADINVGRTQINPSYKLEEQIDVYVDGNSVENVTKIELVAEMDGVEQRCDTMELIERSEYTACGSLVPTDYEWDIDEGSKLMIYVDVYAGDLIWRFAVDGATRKDGSIDNMDLWRNDPIRVSTVDGKVIDFPWAEEYGY